MVDVNESYHVHVTSDLRLRQSVPGVHYFSLALSLERLAATQYRAFNFNSMCKINNGYLGANEHGLFSLEDGETDQDGHIDAFVIFPKTDLGIANEKRFRKIYVGYETSEDLNFYLTPDDGVEHKYVLDSIKTSNKQHGGVFDGQREVVGRYYDIKVENTYGGDFSLDQIEAILVVKGRKPSEV